jgi:hypothetical protein
MKCMRLLTLIGALTLGLSPSFAQTTTTGAIGGTISDQSGAVVRGASVTLTNTANGATQAVVSSSSGSYRFDLIPPGSYKLLIDQSGFSKLETTVTVATAQVLAADLKLTIGSEATIVNVEAVATTLQADNGNVATTVSQKQIEEVPNSGNNMTYVTRLTPGMGTNFGVPGSTTLYTVDGMTNNDPYNNSNNSGASNMMLGVNNVQEATVTGNGYSGQFGGLVGAQVSFVTKSGGNRLHGDLSYFWTGRSLVANNWFNNRNGTKRPFENVNMWSGSIGGPIWKDRLFFYADTEGLRAVLPSASVNVLLPSANLQRVTKLNLIAKGLTKSIPFYQNMFDLYTAAANAHNAVNGNPNASTSVGQGTGCPTSGLSAADVAAIGTGPGACTVSYQGSATTFANEAMQIFRVDTVIGSKDKGFIRYQHDSGSQPTYTDQINPAFSAVSIQPQYSGQLNETHTFGSRAINNFLVSGLWYGAQFGPSNLPATLAVFPAQLTLGDSSLTSIGGTTYSYPTGRNVTTMQAQDDMALSLGSHTLKFGGRAYVVKENDFYFQRNTYAPLITPATLGAYINGGVDPTTPTNNTSYARAYINKQNHPVLVYQIGAYFEDDWKVNRAFSVTAALRLDHQGNVKCLDNCLTLPATDFLSLSHNAATPYNQAFVFNQKDALPGLQQLEWQPRVGFAYNPPILHESLVVRGGVGIFFDGLPGSVMESIANNSPVKNSFSVSGDNIANTETQNLWNDGAALNSAFTAGISNGGTVASIKASLPANLQPFFTPPNLYAPQNNFKMFQLYKWNFEVQKSFGNTTTLSVNYMGNHGIHKPFSNSGLNAYSNTVAGLPSAPTDSRFGPVYYFQSAGMSNYNALITTVTQRFRGGNVITAGYTYGKTLDMGSNNLTTTTTGTTDVGGPPDPYNTNRFYGPAASDIRNYLTLNYVYQVPFKNFFYGGWQVAGAAFAYSGLPFTVIDTAKTNTINKNTATNGFYGTSLVANYNYSGEGSCNSPNAACLTTSQFSSTTSVASTGPRNGFRGPKYVSTDVSVTKNIPLHWEGGQLSIAAQAFNVLNHPNFSRPAATLNSTSFGKITTVLNPSGIFSGVGGDNSPRILQLKAKLVF